MWEYEQAVCPQCGNLRAVCEDPNTGWYPQRSVCYSSAAAEVANRKWHKKNENAKPDPAGYLPTDGTVVWASAEDLTPDDNFI